MWILTIFEAGETVSISRVHYQLVGNPHMVAMQTLNLAILTLLGGDLERAVQEMDDGYQQFKELGFEPEPFYSVYWR